MLRELLYLQKVHLSVVRRIKFVGFDDCILGRISSRPPGLLLSLVLECVQLLYELMGVILRIN